MHICIYVIVVASNYGSIAIFRAHMEYKRWDGFFEFSNNHPSVYTPNAHEK